MENEIYEIIKDWWNDTMRKDWRTALADSLERHNRLEELADNISTHLTNHSTRR